MLLLRLLSTAGWDFALAGAFLITWISPYALGESAINPLSALMLLEFVALHAGGLMSGNDAVRSSGAWGRLVLLILMAIGYMALALSLGGAYDNPHPIAVAIGAMVPRLFGILVPARDEEELKERQGQWVTLTVIYLVTCFPALMAPMPRFGITPEAVPAITSAGGHLHEHYRFMAWGVLYFVSVGTVTVVLEWAAHRGRRVSPLPSGTQQPLR